MGAGRSRSNLKQCSCMSNNNKRNSQSYHAELCNHPNKYVLTRIPSTSANGTCACNNVFTDCQYNLDPLTAEEQLDEVERMYREKNQTTRSTKRQCADNTITMPTICCNCACICGGGGGGVGGSTPAPVQIERRNGLQNIDRCNGGCQCVLCCENVRDTRMGELTEAEAIANAIREYCCKERERAGNGGKSASCKCCACKQSHTTEEAATRGQVIEDEDEDDEAADADVEEEEEVEIVKHKRVVKKELVVEEKMQSKMREDELTEEEEIEYIEPAPEERRRSQDSAGVRPEQKHAKSCKCCACKKKATQNKDLDSDSDENIISLEDIELEVQTDVISTQRDQFDKPTSPSNNRNSQVSSAKRNRCCTCEKATTTDFLQETEVLMRNTNVLAESSEELTSTPAKRTRTQANRQVDEEAMARPQRRLSEEPRTEKSNRRDQTHALGCKCCECKRKIREIEILTRDTHRNPRNEEDNRRRRRSIEDEQAPRSRETQLRRDVRDEKWEQQDALAMAAARQPRRQSTRPEAASAPSRPPSGGKRGCECKPRNRRVETYEPVNMDQEPNKSTDSEVDSSDNQPCCCFQRQKTQPKRADVKGNGCSKSCRCKEEPSAAAQSPKRVKRTDSELNVSEPKTPQRKRRNSEQAASSSKEADCATPCTCKKTKGVPLTKCCKCTEEMVHAMARERDEDTKRRELAEELAERLQKRAELQIALQKRLQQQMSGKQSQQGCCCCCCEQPPYCMPTYPCCESVKQTEPIPLGCYEAPPCCCLPTPCCFQTPACCYEAPPCYGQECPCCCQPMPYTYSASCSYPKSGAC